MLVGHLGTTGLDESDGQVSLNVKSVSNRPGC